MKCNCDDLEFVIWVLSEPEQELPFTHNYEFCFKRTYDCSWDVETNLLVMLDFYKSLKMKMWYQRAYRQGPKRWKGRLERVIPKAQRELYPADRKGHQTFVS